MKFKYEDRMVKRKVKVMVCENCLVALKKPYRLTIMWRDPEHKYRISKRNFINTDNYAFCKPCFTEILKNINKAIK